MSRLVFSQVIPTFVRSEELLPAALVAAQPSPPAFAPERSPQVQTKRKIRRSAAISVHPDAPGLPVSRPLRRLARFPRAPAHRHFAMAEEPSRTAKRSPPFPTHTLRARK